MKPGSFFDFLEPEEFVGKLWHGFLGKTGGPVRYPDAAITLDDVRRSTLVVFRGLGGPAQLHLAQSGPALATHRPSFRERIGGLQWKTVARRDDEALYLPPSVDYFPTPVSNRSLYIWLAAFFAHLRVRDTGPDGITRDIEFLRDVRKATTATLDNAPGLAEAHSLLRSRVLHSRPRLTLPSAEEAVERAVRALLGENEESFDILCEKALREKPKLYRPFLPVILWGRATASSPGVAPVADDADGSGSSEAEDRRITRKASRQDRSETEREDFLALNRFEKILTMTESMNIARPVEDDEKEAAQKAAEDSSEIVLSRHRKQASKRLKLDLELSPSAAADGELTDGTLYPEWDWRRRAYRPNYCRVISTPALVGDEIWEPSPEVLRRIRTLRRQFEALQTRNVTLRSQVDGDELDLDALVRSRADLQAGGIISDRNYLSVRKQSRDLAVALLVDASLSTDSWVGDRRVIDVAREAALLFCQALDAGGDANAVFSFTSNSRKHVHINVLKSFSENMTPRVTQRIGSLKPGHYTRLGAALRHVTAQVEKQQASQRLLLVLTDGKPNDIDHYEGRFGVEDTRRAVHEARRAGVHVFGMTIDTQAQSYFPVLFGKGGYLIVSNPAKLPMHVPKLLRRAKLKN